MSKIYCADVTCEYINDKGICTAKKVSLSWRRVTTVFDGVQEFNRCKTYQKSARTLELEKRIGDLMNGKIRKQ